MKRIVFLILPLLILGIFIQEKLLNVSNDRKVTSCIEDTICKDCNLLLLSVDSLRADHMSAFGYSRITSPNFDSLAKKGVLFKNYFSTSYLTPMSEMSVHTGMYPTSHKLTQFYTVMPKEYKTLSQILKSQGYETKALHNSPEFISHEGVNKSFNRAFDSYETMDTVRKITELNKQIIKDEIESMHKDKSFLWLTIGSIHWPYNSDEEKFFSDKNYSGYFTDKSLDWWDTFSNVYNNTIYPEQRELTDKDLSYITNLYDDGIKRFDNLLKEIYITVRKSGQLDNTVIVIQSEHGEDMGEHGYFSHYDIYDTQTKVPLLIINPKIDKGIQVSKVASGVDVLPTILGMLGYASGNQVEGSSLIPSICNPGEEAGSYAIIERVPLWEQVVNYDQIKSLGLDPQEAIYDLSIRTADWSYILRLSKNYHSKIHWWSILTGDEISIPEEELYFIPSDENQLNNVVTEYPEKAAEFKKILLSRYGDMTNTEEDVVEVVERQEYF